MSTINEDELDGMPEPDHLTRWRVTGVLREEFLADDKLPEVGDELQVRRGARVVSVNRKEGPSSADAVVVTIELDDPSHASKRSPL